VKIRIGVGVSAGGIEDGGSFGRLCGDLEGSGFDSIWLSEVLSRPVIDPLVGLAHAAAVTTTLKLGTTMVLPGRNPVRLAKELATLDRLSEGRLLVTFVPGLRQPEELAALGVTAKARGPMMDEMMPLLRRLWSEPSVEHHGTYHSFEAVAVDPKPLQDPLEMWVGGTAPSALRRTGELSDGWLPAFCTPEEAARGREVVVAHAAAAGRLISPEHFGVSLGYAAGELSPTTRQLVAARRPGVDPATLIPVGLDGLRATVDAFLEVGFSKFVVRPNDAPGAWSAELERLAESLLPLQT
jgi:probable F420-dependent oxidoreductase